MEKVNRPRGDVTLGLLINGFLIWVSLTAGLGQDILALAQSPPAHGEGAAGGAPSSTEVASPDPIALEAREKELKAKIDKNGRDFEAAYELGNLYYDQGRRTEAEESYRRVLKIQADHVPARVNLGVVLNEAGKSEEALVEFDAALKLAPEDVNALCNKGQALYALQRYNEAIDHYRRSIQIDPKSQLAHYLLGIAFADAGIYREAIRDWQKVVSIDPNTDAARTASEGIKVLQDMLKTAP
ncbi:MAG: tetratricopeptide repeat protein [Candidatus Eisenbacteria bacterium]|nr:tetratricopeptide repeat protein [Candidatus Eisenbacteria bacterium]MCC7144145.1 tetratricopeptide repeat protein [Candidatus Eisenbacteria bacterium]